MQEEIRMETSILVTPDQYTSDSPIPVHLRPTRASASTNFLISIVLDNPVLVLHNFDPVTYDTWYPPFYFTPWSLPKTPETYQEMCNQVLIESPPESKPDVHSRIGADKVRERFGLSRFEFVASPSFEKEVWLKFSNSKKEWTVYRFNYFYASDLSKDDLISEAREKNLAFLPLDASLKHTLSDGQFQGKPIVDNLVRLLSDPSRVELLRSIAL